MLSLILESKQPIGDLPVCESLPGYDQVLDNIESLIDDICDWLSEIPGVEFKVTGFELEWIVDVRVDLSTIVWQVPDVLKALFESKSVTLDFYEQGVERRLCFQCHGSQVRIECQDLFGKSEPAITEWMELSQLMQMLTEFLKTFIHLATIVCPTIVTHEMFTTWLKKINPLIQIASSIYHAGRNGDG